MTRRLAALALLALLTAACTDDAGGPASPDNRAPVITAVSATPAVVPVGETTVLNAVAEDEDGDALTFTWSAFEGFFPDGTDGASVSWSPPARMDAFTLTVSVTDGTATTRDSLVVNATVPEVAIDPPALDLGTAGVTDAFTVTNAGAGTLGWTATTDRDWLAVDPDAGQLDAGAAATVDVTADRAGLGVGVHTGAVTVSTPFGTGAVTVTLEVPAGEPLTNLFFLHHSTGRNLIAEGNVRGRLAQIDPALEFWDHDYNYIGLTDPDGEDAGTSYNIPGDNTDPDGLHHLWTTDNSARARILADHEVIAFKSCYPASDIGSSAELAQYKTWYLEIRDVLDTRPDRIFVVMSPPPRHRLATDADDSARARAFADWLGSAEYLDGHPNVVFFDLFDELANDDDVLKYEYERSHSSDDSHPNAAANAAVGPRFADALAAAAGSLRR